MNEKDNNALVPFLRKVDSLFQLIPSAHHHGGAPPVAGLKRRRHADSKALRQFIEEAKAFKEQLGTKLINTNDSHCFLTTVGHIIFVLDLFCTEYEVQLPYLDRKTGEFPKPYDRAPMQHNLNKKKLRESGWRLSRCFFVIPDFDSDGIAQEISATGSETYEAHGEDELPTLDPNREVPQSDDVYYDEKKKKIWLDFKEFDKEEPKHEVSLMPVQHFKKITIDHPIVSVVGGFAVAAFNKASGLHVNEIEFMEFKYLKRSEACNFDMTIEAIQEGNLGVYEAQVVCNWDGDRFDLTHFFLTNRKPIGTKAMAISLFSCLRSVRRNLEVMTFDEVRKLGKILDVVKVRKHQEMPVHKQAVLLDLFSESIKGIYKLLLLGLPLFFSRDCNRKTNSGGNPDPFTLKWVDLVTSSSKQGKKRHAYK